MTEQEWYTEYDKEVWTGASRETISSIALWWEDVSEQVSKSASKVCKALLPLAPIVEAYNNTHTGETL